MFIPNSISRVWESTLLKIAEANVSLAIAAGERPSNEARVIETNSQWTLEA